MALRHVWLALMIGLGSGCLSTLRYEAPKGFALANRDWRSAHYKASDNVGLKVLVFDNVEGGTLAYWSEDLVRKLQAREYTLKERAAVQTGNGVAGTRFELVVEGQFLVVNLFVTDDFIYVAQVAGDERLLGRYRGLEVGEGLRARGCKGRESVCRG